MAMNCGMECIKYLLFIFNFILAICGLGILIVGVIFHVNYDELNLKGEGIPSSIIIGMIVVGAIVFIIAFFGCCGAIRDSHCMVITFAVFLLTILVIQVAIGVYAYMHKINGESLIAAYRSEAFDKYGTNEKATKFVDTVQETIQCCGVKGPEDFGVVPQSCCSTKIDGKCSRDKAFKDGCGPKITDTLKSVKTTAGHVAIGVGVVEIVGIIFALCLANAIRNEDRRGYRV